MAYHYSIQLEKPFEAVVSEITDSLKRQGFGIITSIDMKATLKEKLNVDFRDYRILGACNPKFAHRALGVEPQIGVMLPCNVVVQRYDNGKVGISAVNPMETMDKSLSAELKEIAREVSERLRTAVDELHGEKDEAETRQKSSVA